MIAIPSGSRVWIATGHTDMRRGMQGLALQVQEGLKRDQQAWLADVLSRIATHPDHRLDELLPWNWTRASAVQPRWLFEAIKENENAAGSRLTKRGVHDLASLHGFRGVP